DAALSMRKLPWASRSVLANVALCVEWDEASRGFFEADARSETVRYEDLVADPERELTRLCGVVGEVLEPRRRAPSSSAGRLAPRSEWGKADGGRPIAAGGVQAWEREMAEADRAEADRLAHPILIRHGYHRPPAPWAQPGVRTWFRLASRPGFGA